MQRIAVLLVCTTSFPASSGTAQQAAGTALWRLVATTLPLPPALATGTAAVFWNPAQIEDSARTQLGLEGIETPGAIGASGMIAAIRIRAGRVGQIGFVYGHVGLSDLTRTGDSPDPIGSAVPVYTSALELTWSRPVSASPRRHISSRPSAPAILRRTCTRALSTASGRVRSGAIGASYAPAT